MKITAEITEIGSQALITNDDFWVLFDESATTDLKSVSVIQKFISSQQSSLHLKKGDCISIDQQSFEIQALGQQVNEQLQTIGHTVLYFREAPVKPQINGIYLGKTIPKIKVGSKITYEQ